MPPDAAAPASPVRSPRAVVFLIAAVQFVNILDFMMVMPLGPLFAAGLGFPTSRVGLVGGSYTAAAGLAGILGSFFLERFDRRKALGVAVLGLVLSTAAGGLWMPWRPPSAGWRRTSRITAWGSAAFPTSPARWSSTQV